MSKLSLNLRQQRLGQEGGRARWEVVAAEVEYDCASTALLLCDVWNKHWSRGASERVDAMVPRMNEVAAAARASGVQIVHAPSSTMEFYAGHAGAAARPRHRAGRPAARPRAGGSAAAGRLQRRGLGHEGGRPAVPRPRPGRHRLDAAAPRHRHRRRRRPGRRRRQAGVQLPPPPGDRQPADHGGAHQHVRPQPQLRDQADGALGEERRPGPRPDPTRCTTRRCPPTSATTRGRGWWSSTSRSSGVRRC